MVDDADVGGAAVGGADVGELGGVAGEGLVVEQVGAAAVGGARPISL